MNHLSYVYVHSDQIGNHFYVELVVDEVVLVVVAVVVVVVEVVVVGVAVVVVVIVVKAFAMELS